VRDDGGRFTIPPPSRPEARGRFGSQSANELGAPVASSIPEQFIRRSKQCERACWRPHPRYEREKPGEIIHLDIKKLGRFSSVGHRITGRRTGYCSSQGAGWEFVHVAIDDHSRIARAEIFPDQKKESAVAFLLATVAYFRSLGITVERVMTDNGSCYLSKAFARACKQLAVKHISVRRQHS